MHTHPEDASRFEWLTDPDNLKRFVEDISGYPLHSREEWPAAMRKWIDGHRGPQLNPPQPPLGATPEPSAKKVTIAEAREIARSIRDDAEKRRAYRPVCHCGDYMDTHHIGSGHAPVEMRDDGPSNEAEFQVAKLQTELSTARAALVRMLFRPVR